MARSASNKSARKRSSSTSRGRTAAALSRSSISGKERVEKVGRLLRERISDIVIDVDAPSRPEGDWFIDTRMGDRSFVIEFRPTLGFGLSSVPSEGLGEGPDEFFKDEASIVERVAELLRTRGSTQPERVRLLQELREQQHVSQVTLAVKLGVRQPTISKIERREDVNLSTLRRYIEALGGKLHVTARFPDGAVEIGAASHRDKRARTRR
jgi:DNA-binding XRE family transcriptional regulator